MEKLSILPDDECVMLLAQAVAWAEATMPIYDLPEWVFSGSIALQQAQGRTLKCGAC